MTIEYNIKGITLTAAELSVISQYYAAACTAEYLLNTHKEVKTEELALEIGYDVHRKMQKYDYDEATAIDESMCEHFGSDYYGSTYFSHNKENKQEENDED